MNNDGPVLTVMWIAIACIVMIVAMIMLSGCQALGIADAVLRIPSVVGQ